MHGFQQGLRQVVHEIGLFQEPLHHLYGRVRCLHGCRMDGRMPSLWYPNALLRVSPLSHVYGTLYTVRERGIIPVDFLSSFFVAKLLHDQQPVSIFSG